MKKREGRYNPLPRFCLFVITRPAVISLSLLCKPSAISSAAFYALHRRLPCALSAVSPTRPPPFPLRVLRHLPYPSSAISLTRPPPSPVRVLRRLPCVSSLSLLCVICRLSCLSSLSPPHVLRRLPYASSAISFACFCYLLCASSTISCTGPLMSALQILH
ncbi:hypothetical protein PoB_003695800 [Plakobranchus ocellatus]|uniref:Uncharacterized protein n=1 Tax=Plakobranchus ocellatus TaxID=259542 RepID=A0AAV4AV63_9GAST|nr:hypothetical protein PoB_003695800 [Plakobranchus ocellatus]